MLKNCECYLSTYGKAEVDGLCGGTFDLSPCCCDGDPLDCDFFEDVRDKAIDELCPDDMVSRREILKKLNKVAFENRDYIPAWIVYTILGE